MSEILDDGRDRDVHQRRVDDEHEHRHRQQERQPGARRRGHAAGSFVTHARSTTPALRVNLDRSYGTAGAAVSLPCEPCESFRRGDDETLRGEQEGESASQLISKRIAELGDWRGETLGRIRALIKEADPDILEEWKWMGTPVWSHDGIVCTGETYKNVVKMTFAKGASLKDPSRLFNSSLDGNVRRAIDIHEGEKIDAPALKALIRAAVALNVSGKKGTSKR